MADIESIDAEIVMTFPFAKSAVALLLALAVSVTAAAPKEPVVEVYKSPDCGCCGAWVEHLRQAGFQVQSHDVGDVPGTRARLGMPERYGSCHTAKVGGYLVEGHVPAADIRRLLKEQPKALGLAAPGMPPGSPGMEGPRALPYHVLLVQPGGSATVYAHHP